MSFSRCALAGLVVLGACSSDTTLAPMQNMAPHAAIASPDDESAFPEGAVIDFVGLLSDSNGLDDIVTVSWSSSIDGALGNPDLVRPDSSGTTRLSAVLTPGTHAITLTATDKGDLSGTDSITVTVSNDGMQPYVEILQPASFAEFMNDETIDMMGLIADPHQPAETVQASWIISRPDGTEPWVLAEGFPSLAGSFGATWSDPDPGQWRIRLAALNDIGLMGEAIVYVTVGDIGDLDMDGDGWTPNMGDCDDNDPLTYPGAPEICGNFKDNDCNEIISDKDVDLDGHIDEECFDYVGALPVDDCDDDDPLVNPSMPDHPDLDYIDANCSGIDGDLFDSVFLDPVGGADTWDGLTLGTPVRSLDRAYDVATSTGRSWVLIGAGDVSLSGNFREGISLAGGYDPTDGWTRKSTIVPTIAVPAAGKVISGWSAETTFQQIEIAAASNSSTGGSSIALRVHNSSNLALEGVVIRSGNAGSGTAGTSQSKAANGGNGSKGGDGVQDSTFLCPSNSRPTRGAAGAVCGTGGHAGGIGGWSGHPEKGSATAGATGGGPGGSGGSAGSGNGQTGGSGSNGAAGGSGANGAAGLAFGTFDTSGYTPSHGSSGTAGSPGRGGGGGGGGGPGGWTWGNCDTWGGAGGGGGAGGCGGAAGTGGTGGGASIALLLVNSEVSIVDSHFVTGSGGNGGAGGSGGAGGDGGSGGAGGSSNTSIISEASGAGGPGGSGGQGGQGGHGGGGGGGPSLGIVCASGATVTVDSATTWSIGSGGAGGTSSGDNGVSGKSNRDHNCGL